MAMARGCSCRNSRRREKEPAGERLGVSNCSGESNRDPSVAAGGLGDGVRVDLGHVRKATSYQLLDQRK